MPMTEIIFVTLVINIPIPEVIAPSNAVIGPATTRKPAIAVAALPIIGCASIKLISDSIFGMMLSLNHFATLASAGSKTAPNLSPTSPSAFLACASLPSSVLANSLFMLPTFFVTTLASIAAFSSSVPYFKTFASASEKVMPALDNAPV